MFSKIWVDTPSFAVIITAYAAEDRQAVGCVSNTQLSYSFFTGGYFDIAGCVVFSMAEVLTWDDSYAIAMILKARFPELPVEEISLGMIYSWTVALPEFDDDPQLANDSILMAIYQEWFEEVNPV